MTRIPQARAGFSLVEVMVALVILSVGVIALMGSSGMVSRMLGEGRHVTVASEVASRRIETLRQAAASTAPHCGAAGFAGGGPVTTAGITERWTVAAGGSRRLVRAIVTYRTTRGSRTDTLATYIPC